MMRGLMLLLCLYCSATFADCYVHSNIRLIRQNIIAGPTDIQRMVVPDTAGSKCVVNYRVFIENEWRTAEGAASAKTEGEACTRAMDIGRGQILAEIEPDRITADMALVCSDIPKIQIRKVRVGETIWESETDWHANPQERKYFVYKRNKCRLFTERAFRENNMIIYQGIICKQNDTPDSKWQVVDKY